MLPVPRVLRPCTPMVVLMVTMGVNRGARRLQGGVLGVGERNGSTGRSKVGAHTPWQRPPLGPGRSNQHILRRPTLLIHIFMYRAMRGAI